MGHARCHGHRRVVRLVLALAPCAFALLCTPALSCAGSDDRPESLGKFEFDAAAPPDAAKDPHDQDGDGYTPETGDCNEYNALVNPGAFEYVGNEVDDDCDTVVDNGYADCDGEALNVANPAHAARAMNICPAAFVVDAEYKLAANSAQRRIAVDFGPNVPAPFGSTLLVLSTGRALLPDESGFVPTEPGTQFNLEYARPASYAQKASCPVTNDPKVYDATDLLLTLKAPTNAKAFSFNVRFFTAEYPNYYCSLFNDGFAAIMTSSRYSKDNIAYGSEGEMLSVNVSFWAVCEDIESYDGCKDAPDTIAGTGFGPEAGTPHGATRWLTTKAPVEPGEEFTLRLLIWDEGDAQLDSTVLLDNFRWDIQPAEKESTVELPK